MKSVKFKKYSATKSNVQLAAEAMTALYGKKSSLVYEAYRDYTNWRRINWHNMFIHEVNAKMQELEPQLKQLQAQRGKEIKDAHSKYDLYKESANDYLKQTGQLDRVEK